MKNMLKQQKIDENLQNNINSLIKNGNISNFIFSTPKWLSPKFYQFSQPFGVNNTKDELKYLNKLYQINENFLKIREKSLQWLKEKFENWLKEICLNVSGKYRGFTMIIGGSTLLGTATINSDIDIIFLISSLCLLKFNKCNECKENNYLKPCNQHDLIFGENDDSFYFYLRKELKKNYSEQMNSSTNNFNSFHVNSIANARVPLIELIIEGLEMDIMIAPIPVSEIPLELNLNKNNNKEIIKENIYIINELIKQMTKLNDNQYIQSILILTGYRVAYRTKFLLINSEREEIFTNLLRFVKQWAIAKQIYSNLFGYLSGTILLILTAKICLLFPNGNLIFLIKQFFLIYSIWPWPLPLILDTLENSENDLPNNYLLNNWNLNNLNPTNTVNDGEQMPVISSLFPKQNTAYNVNKYNLNIIKKEMNKACNILVNENNNSFILNENNLILKQLDYKNQFCHFLIIECTELTENNNLNQKLNLQPSCGQIKIKIRTYLYYWVEKTEIQLKNKETIILKNNLINYHILSGFTRKKQLNEENIQMFRIIWLVGLNFKENNCSSTPLYINEIVSILNFHLGKFNKRINNYSLNSIYTNNLSLENIIESRLGFEFEEEFNQNIKIKKQQINHLEQKNNFENLNFNNKLKENTKEIEKIYQIQKLIIWPQFKENK